MKSRLLLAVSLLVCTAVTAAPLPGAEHDPHKLSADEERIVLPALCRGAIPEKHQFNCAELIGYPSDGSAFNEHTRRASGEISFATIAYGHFTSPNAQEAYVTYSGLESHSDGFGGGILLRGSDSGWKPVRWIAGGQMDHCVALPDPGPRRMLCLSGYTGMGEADTSVWVIDVGRDGKLRRTSVLKAQDGRGASNTAYYCKGPASAHQSMLLEIDDLARSQLPGVLATSTITYATATNVRRACALSRFANVGTDGDEIRYRLSQGKIVIDPPPKFAMVDY